MVLWGSVSVVMMIALIILALRVEGGQTLGTRQALFLGAFCFGMFGLYNAYQWSSIKTAPSEVEVYVPLYPESKLRTRVPVEQMQAIHGLLSTSETEDPVRGQWIFETDDTTVDVGKFYEKWSTTAPNRVGVDIMQEHSEVIVDSANYSFTVLANNQWGKTRITYTLMAPLD